MERRPDDDAATIAYSPYARTVAATPVDPALPGEEPIPLRSVVPGDPRYEAKDRLGEGGMGEVRLVRDARTERDVAMKVMRAAQEGRADLHARFLREARVQARMEHPSIVPVYDLASSGGRPYFTMKRVRGATLTEVLARLRIRDREAVLEFTPRKLLAAFANVCLTVDFAHAHGVVHRDLKPDNIMLGAFGELYVLDWGIARLAKADTAWSTDPDLAGSKTRAGSVFGTLGYMAPEQVDPKLGETDVRSDVYALGAILFEILTLEPLHPVGSVDAMVASTLASAKHTPSSRAGAAFVAPELDALCARATERDAARRFASARELYEALERFREKDRDVDQLRAGAEEHAARAAAAVEGALAEADALAPLRTACLREASRALAFDPGHEGALGTLRTLLASPPRVSPAEVERDLEETTRRLATRRGRVAALLQLSWFLYLPFALAVGIRSVPLYAGVSALLVTTALATLAYARNPPKDGALPWRTQLLVATAMGALSVAWSPLVLVPSLAVLVAVAWIVVPRRRGWPWRELLAASAIVGAPAILSAAGVVPPFFAVGPDAMLILPRMMALPMPLTLYVVAATHVLLLVSVAAIVILLRNALNEADRASYAQAWQLRQLALREGGEGERRLSIEPPPRSERASLVATAVDSTSGRTGLHEPLAGEADAADRYDRRGAMTTEVDGEVQLCEDRRIGRQVALMIAGEDHAAFLQKAKLQARLEHPSIPPVYDVGEDAAGVPYVTTRRLRGASLADVRRGAGGLSWHRVLEAFAAACLAVDSAHHDGVAHAALSSRCVIVGDYGDVYVTGWSRAESLEGKDAAAAAGARKKDVAALGALLAELLRGEYARAVDPEAGPLSVRAAPPELDTIVAGAAEGGGIDDAGALRAAVERYLEGDRDVGRRRALAAEHALAAEALAERALAASDAASRAAAMGKVSLALALDPSNARATGALMRLLTAPPRELPPTASRELSLAEHVERRGSAKIAGYVYAAALVFVPIVLVQGVLSWPLFAVLLAAILGTIAASFRAARDPVTRSRESRSTVVFSMLAACATGAVAGPLVLTPTIAIANLCGFLLQGGTRRRVLIVTLACLAFAGPLALQLAHVLPPSYGTRGEALAVFPVLVRFSSVTPFILTFAQTAFVVATCIFFLRFRDVLQAAEERALVAMWQLRQLVPPEAKAALSVPPPPSAGAPGGRAPRSGSSPNAAAGAPLSG